MLPQAIWSKERPANMKNIKVFIYLIFVILMLSCLSASFAVDDLMLVGFDNNYPPYEFLKSDIPEGFNIDIFKAVADVTGLKYKLESDTWDHVRTKLETKQLHILTGMFYSPERDKLVDFTTPTLVVSQTLFVRNDSKVTTIKELNGKTILVQRGDIMNDYLKEQAFSGKIIAVENQEEAIKRLSKGEGDAALLLKLQGYYFIKKEGIKNVKAVGNEIFQKEYCMAVQEGDRELLNLLNEGLFIIKSNGTYDEIYKTWFGVSPQDDIKKRTIDLLKKIVVPITIVIITIIFWLWSLKKQVRSKTQALVELNESIKQMNQDLELKVSERTTELITTNEYLEQSLAELEELHAIQDEHQIQLELKNNELSDLIAHLNDAQKQLINTERFATLGSLVAGVAHEINTPLGISVTLSSHLNNLYKDLKKQFENQSLSRTDMILFMDESEEALKLMDKNLTRSADLISSFKQVAVDQSSLEKRKFKLLDMTNDIIVSLKPQFKTKNILVHIDCDDKLEITSYPGSWTQIITNLVINSLIHGFKDRDNGNIKLSFSLNKSEVVFIYSDDGLGISNENLPKVFDPFFSTGKNSGSTGLGLHIVYNIVSQILEGEIDLQNNIENGIQLTIKFKPE